MKKTYEKPAMTVVTINMSHYILNVSNLDGNAGLRGAGADGSITGGSGPARARSNGGTGWDDWDE